MDFDATIKRTLSNGLRVLMLPDDRYRSASVNFWIGSGSRFESAERAGCSHFVEHMLFKGTQSRSALEVAEQMDAIGGHLNAYTAKEYTCLYSRTLRNHLPLAIDIMCDMLTSPRLAPEDIETERGVILEEIGMYEDSPEDLLADNAYSAVWGSHPLGTNILGSRDTVSAMTADDMRAHMNDFYTAPRIVCALCGDFDCDEVSALLEERLGSLPSVGAPFTDSAADFHTTVRTVEKPIEQIHLCLMFPSVASNDPRRHALNILNSVCGGSSSSRLFQRIREQLGLAYSVGSANVLNMREGFFSVDAAVSPKSEDAALREIVAELCRLRRDGITPKEFERAREQMRASILMGLESNSSIASHIARGELYNGHIRTIAEIIASIDSVTLDEVNDAAKTFIDFDNFSLCAVGKVGSQEHYNSIVKNSIV